MQFARALPADRIGSIILWLSLAVLVAAAGARAGEDAHPPPGDSAAVPLFSAQRIFVRSYRFEGNTAFSDAELQRETAAWRNREITFEELMELRHRLTQFYIRQGYINSGVIVPDQKVTDGSVTLRVVEGRLQEITVTGNQRLRGDYIRRRLALGAAPPLNIRALERQIRLMHENPLLTRINAEVKPGNRPGRAVLRAKVEEAPPFLLNLSLANDRSPAVGGNRLEINASHGNMTGRGDRFSFRIGLVREPDNVTDGMNDFDVAYQVPVTARDTLLKAYFRAGDALVVEEPLDEIDITSRSYTLGLSVGHPFIRREGRELAVSLALEKRQSKTSLLNEPFSFSQGVEDGESDVSVLRCTQEWLDRGRDRVLAARSVFSLGLDALDATTHGDLPDGRFFAWLGQFQWARRFDRLRGTQFVFRTDVQLASESLLPMEKFSVGGIDSVRGYRRNLMVRDSGLAAAIEARIPLGRVPLPGVTRGPLDGLVQLAPFADFGWARNTDGPDAAFDTIGSVGVGVRWSPLSNLHAEIYWGYPFQDVENITHTLQDEGIHFRFSWRPY